MADNRDNRASKKPGEADLEPSRRPGGMSGQSGQSGKGGQSGQGSPPGRQGGLGDQGGRQTGRKDNMGDPANEERSGQKSAPAGKPDEDDEDEEVDGYRRDNRDRWDTP